MNKSTAAFLITALLAVPSGASEAATPKKPGSTAAASKKKSLSPAAEKFIRGIGLDPRSPDVKRAIADGTIETLRTPDEPMSHSLESLAKEKNEAGVIKFIQARVLIHKLKTDFEGTPAPERGAGVETAYLTVKERRLVLDKVFPKKN